MNSVEERLKLAVKLSAWALLVGIVVLAVSGWGITRTETVYNASFGLVDRRLANSIHRATNIPVAVFFLSHVLIRAHLMLTGRHPERARLTGSVLTGAGVILLAVVIYMELIA